MGRTRNSSQRRDIIFSTELDLYGDVICYVCNKTVHESDATLEHITPKSKGGTLRYDNLTISHKCCNWERADFIGIIKSNAAMSRIKSVADAISHINKEKQEERAVWALSGSKLTKRVKL